MQLYYFIFANSGTDVMMSVNGKLDIKKEWLNLWIRVKSRELMIV